jgi:hypothetical protein
VTWLVIDPEPDWDKDRVKNELPDEQAARDEARNWALTLDRTMWAARVEFVYDPPENLIVDFIEAPV